MKFSDDSGVRDTLAMLLEEAAKKYLKAQKSAPNQKQVGVRIMMHEQAKFVISKSNVRNEDKTGLPQSGKIIWKMKDFPGQGKVREFHFQSGKFRKIKKVMEKSGNFKIFQMVAS